MAIKKAYQAIVSLLEANREETVDSIIDNVIALASAKTGGGGGTPTSFHKDSEGNIIAIRCSYHQQWCDPTVVEFGKKVSSASGFSSMSKSGTSHWTKQLRDFKQAKEQLLTDVAEGVVDAADLPTIIADLEEARKVIAPLDGGFDTLDECLQDIADRA